MLKGYVRREKLHKMTIYRFGAEKVVNDVLEQMAVLQQTILRQRRGNAYTGDVKRELIKLLFGLETIAVLYNVNDRDLAVNTSFEEKRRRELLKNARIDDFVKG